MGGGGIYSMNEFKKLDRAEENINEISYTNG